MMPPTKLIHYWQFSSTTLTDKNVHDKFFIGSSEQQVSVDTYITSHSHYTKPYPLKKFEILKGKINE